MAGDFQKQFDEAIKEAELDGVKDTLNDVRNLNPASKIKDHLNPIKEDLQDAKKLVEEAGEFDPDKHFDESKLPEPPKPVKVDVDAALERQRKANEAEKAELSAEARKLPSQKRARPRPKSKPKAKTASAKSKTAASKSTAKSRAKKTSSQQQTVHPENRRPRSGPRHRRSARARGQRKLSPSRLPGRAHDANKKSTTALRR